MRCAFTTDVAACTAWSSARSAPVPGRTGDGAGSCEVTGPAPSLRRSSTPAGGTCASTPSESNSDS
jgi:hypothetical protein